MFRIWLSIAVAGSALIAVGAAQADRGVHPAEPAGTYMTGVVKEKLADQYDLAWQSLYAPHQRVASLDAYVACESLTSAAGELTLIGIKVLRTFDERIHVAGVQRKLMTRAVTVRVKVAWPIYTPFPVTIEQTFHAIAVRGEWKWILSADQYAYYSAGECPYA
jgi:hypothetical protein